MILELRSVRGTGLGGIMAEALVLGGGFAGVVAAESLAKRLGSEHRITLVSLRREFTFFPALVRLAFGQCELGDVFFNLDEALESRRIRFIQGEATTLNPSERYVVIADGGVERKVEYDYLLLALGRSLAMDSVKGLSGRAHHLLSAGAALRFGEAVKSFHEGHAVIGYCQDARLAVPVYETAFALDRFLKRRRQRHQVRITIVSPEKLGGQLGGAGVATALQTALDEHDIEFKPDFPIDLVSEHEVWSSTGNRLGYDLLMLIPPFEGPGETMYTGIADVNNYVRVNLHMKAVGAEGIYAAGDCTDFLGPKMGHMAILQGEVAAANIAAEIQGREPDAKYNHQLMLVIDEGGKDSIYLRKDLWEMSEASIGKHRFWGWAKRLQKNYWEQLHS